MCFHVFRLFSSPVFAAQYKIERTELQAEVRRELELGRRASGAMISTAAGGQRIGRRQPTAESSPARLDVAAT